MNPAGSWIWSTEYVRSRGMTPPPESGNDGAGWKLVFSTKVSPAAEAQLGVEAAASHGE